MAERPKLGEISLLGLVLANKWAFVVSGVLMVILAIIYLVNATPIYRATVMAVPAEWETGIQLNSGLLGAVSGFAGLGSVGSRDRTSEYLAVLESRSFLEQFVEENKLLPVLYAESEPEEEEPRTMWDGYRAVLGMLRVEQDAVTRIITISMDYKDPALAAEWVNKLVLLLNRVVRERAAVEAQANLKFLNDELKSTNAAEIRTSIFSLMENEIRTQMLANVREDYALRVVDAALPPDENDVHSPKSIQVLFLALMFSAFLASVYIFLITDVRQHA